MSYLRAPLYVWSDGQDVHVWDRDQTEMYGEYVRDCDFKAGIAIPTDVFDALALMRVAEIDASRNRRKYELLALERYGGNFGSAALYERLGVVPPWRRDRSVEGQIPSEQQDQHDDDQDAAESNPAVAVGPIRRVAAADETAAQEENCQNNQNEE